jgi:hypothetical protein
MTGDNEVYSPAWIRSARIEYCTDVNDRITMIKVTSHFQTMIKVTSHFQTKASSSPLHIRDVRALVPDLAVDTASSPVLYRSNMVRQSWVF